MCKNQTYDARKVEFKSLTVSKDKCSDYWCTIVVEDDSEELERDLSKLTDVEHNICNLDNVERSRKKLATLLRKFSRSEEGSKRRELLEQKIEKVYRKIANQKSDYLNKSYAELLGSYDKYQEDEQPIAKETACVFLLNKIKISIQKL